MLGNVTHGSYMQGCGPQGCHQGRYRERGAKRGVILAKIDARSSALRLATQDVNPGRQLPSLHQRSRQSRGSFLDGDVCSARRRACHPGGCDRLCARVRARSWYKLNIVKKGKKTWRLGCHLGGTCDAETSKKVDCPFFALVNMVNDEEHEQEQAQANGQARGKAKGKAKAKEPKWKIEECAASHAHHEADLGIGQQLGAVDRAYTRLRATQRRA